MPHGQRHGAQGLDEADLDALGGDLAHPAIGLVVLLVVQVLNVYKPRGMTRYGCRRQAAEVEGRRRQEAPVP